MNRKTFMQIPVQSIVHWLNIAQISPFFMLKSPVFICFHGQIPVLHGKITIGHGKIPMYHG
jgi:hypothetical protein